MIKFQTALTLTRYYGSFLSADLAAAYIKYRRAVERRTLEHIKAAVQWLCRAQDAFDDGGVARSYSFIYNPYFKRKGWVPSYPETTGYIIPTMFDYAHLVKSDEIFERAVRMADWECDVQMKSGAVQGGTIDQPPTPAIFNTGQVIFGWIRAFEETGRGKYLECAVKAGRYLVEHQEKDGSWRKNLSNYAGKQMLFYTYNTRTAWALLLLSTCANDASFKESAIKNIDFALEQQTDNGWFKSNCLSDPSRPLLHTIAYCTQGILEAGELLKKKVYIDRARLTADALITKQRPDGSIAGCFDQQWQPTVTWTCLTGAAQISIIWGRLFQVTGEKKYLKAMTKVNAYLRDIQLLKTRNPDIYGGIAGSDPLHGEYGKFEILNWAVKFFIDAQLLEMSIHAH